MLTHCDGRAAAPRTFNDWWKEAVRYADVDHRKLHAARRTAASRLIAARATSSAVVAWLGHADGGTLVLRTYAYTDASEVDAVAALLGKPGPLPQSNSDQLPFVREILRRRNRVMRPSYSVAVVTPILWRQ